jgi:hypothetical protein
MQYKTKKNIFQKTALAESRSLTKHISHIKQKLNIPKLSSEFTASHCKPAAGCGNTSGSPFCKGLLTSLFTERNGLEKQLEHSKRRYYALLKQYPGLALAA